MEKKCLPPITVFDRVNLSKMYLIESKPQCENIVFEVPNAQFGCGEGMYVRKDLGSSRLEYVILCFVSN